MDNTQDILKGVLASLTAQMNNLPEGGKVKEVYVNNFHEQLDALENIGISVERFRVPYDQVQHTITSKGGVVRRGYVSEPRYSTNKYVDRSILMTKIETVLRFFEIQKEEIGFRT